jgi:hypothetical protein
MDPPGADKIIRVDLLQQREQLACQLRGRGQGDAQFPAGVQEQVDMVGRKITKALAIGLPLSR